MNDFDFSKLGKQISDTVEDVINSIEIQDIKDNVKNSIHSTIKEVKESVNDAASKANQTIHKTVSPYVPPKKIYLPVTKKPKGKIAGILMTVFGSIGATVFGILAVIFLVFGVIQGTIALNYLGLAAAGLTLSIGSVMIGQKISARIRRFKTYIHILKEHAFCDTKPLAIAVEQKERFVIKDLKRMIKKGWFLEGHFDDKKTCFMATEEAYQQYLKAEESRKLREKEEQRQIEQKAQDEEKRVQERELLYSNPQARELAGMIEEGQNYINQIRRSNDAILGEEISIKLDRLELISSKIFDYIQKKPEKMPEIRKFMNYYLPTTLKMVNAYGEFDKQPIQGENIKKGKSEIEKGLDSVNMAFEKLFDKLFQEDMLDISTDISVLSTMLSGDGLMGSDFAKEER